MPPRETDEIGIATANWQREEVTIGILAALPVEGAAMAGLIDGVTSLRVREDPNTYRIGHLPSADPDRPHRIALAVLPRDGTRQAAATCAELLRTFPGVRCVIMTGIAGGIPRPADPERHVRLGDIVVASDGIVDYGHVSQVEGKRTLRRSDGQVSSWLGRAARELQIAESAGERPWEAWLDPERTPAAGQYRRPSDDNDRLFVRRIQVPHPDTVLSGHRAGLPKVHYGCVASGDVLMRDEVARDDLATEFGNLVAMEMEGSGIAASTAGHDMPWFMVRGVTDYCENSGKTDVWHRYASYAAGAYVRALLAACPAISVPGDRVRPLVDASEQADLDGLFRLAAGVDLRSLWEVATDLPRPPLDSMVIPERAFHYLSKVNANVDGLPPALAFVEEMAALVDDPAAAAGLRRWVDDKAARWRVTEALAARRRRGPPAADGYTAKPCLLIEIAMVPVNRKRCEITSWIQERSGPWRPRAGPDTPGWIPFRHAEAAVADLVNRVEREWRGDAEVTIEFLLPTGLLNTPVEWWPSGVRRGEAPFGVDYPVVLRSLDRMRNGRRPRMWAARWRSLAGTTPEYRVHWGADPGTDEDLAAWGMRLRGDESLASVVLSGPPERRPGREELEMALSAGVPVILWDRRPDRPPEGTDAIRVLVGGDPADLPERTRTLRTEAAATASADRAAHPGRFVALIWDNPNRVVGPRREADEAA